MTRLFEYLGLMSKNKTTKQIIHMIISLQEHNCHNSFSAVGITEKIAENYFEFTTMTCKSQSSVVAVF